MSVFIHEVPPPPGDGPLAAVKDNIDVAGMPTTAGCPGYAYTPARDATCVARLRASGARIIGKTNLDQFATGLVGTRSPYGVPKNPFDPDRVPGGSSSGSAVAVATGQVRIALGTDTAGSGRVPAAFCNIVGLKPTRGWVPTRGVVPACRSLDCVSVFALTVQEAWKTLTAIAGPDPEDPGSRIPAVPCLPSGRLRIGVPLPAEMDGIDPAWSDGWQRTVDTLQDLGHVIAPIDFSPFRLAAAALYGGAWVAERSSAVGDAVAAGIAGLDPTVSAIIAGGRGHDAVRLFRDIEAMDTWRLEAARQWRRMDVMLLPTAPFHPTLAEVAADPIGANARLGRFTNFANLLDTCAAAIPTGCFAGLPTGVTLFAPAWHDLLVARLGAALQDQLGLSLGATGRRLAAPQVIHGDDGGVAVAVFGAHLTGQPLNHQLVALGGRLLESVRTSASYRLHALATTPAKPGLVRCGAGGACISGELWRLSWEAFGRFTAAIPPPLGIGTVELEDGRQVKGFLAEPLACADAEDISSFGSWPAWLASRG
ncbi:MAG: allophanate hydrolase [Planctomycetes bacterium]|nr:allophanate hydrolase [Planctomycetota bacterium]